MITPQNKPTSTTMSQHPSTNSKATPTGSTPKKHSSKIPTAIVRVHLFSLERTHQILGLARTPQTHRYVPHSTSRQSRPVPLLIKPFQLLLEARHRPAVQAITSANLLKQAKKVDSLELDPPAANQLKRLILLTPLPSKRLLTPTDQINLRIDLQTEQLIFFIS